MTTKTQTRTAADLADRGFKLVGLERLIDYSAKPCGYRPAMRPMEYKLVNIAEAKADRDHAWYAVVSTPGKLGAAQYRSRLAGRSGMRAKAVGPFATNVAAAHAALDSMGL